MAKIAAESESAAARLERQRQIPSPAAQIQNTRIRFCQNRSDTGDRAGAPVTIDIERQQMIQQVVSGSDAAEHAAHPGGGLLLILGSCRGRPAACLLGQQASASSMAASTNGSWTSAVIFTDPMRSGSTKWMRPCTVFLSFLSRAASRAGSIPASVGKGP